MTVRVRPDTERLQSLLAEMKQNPPESVTLALRDQGLSADDLDRYARESLSNEELETLRQVVLHAARSGSSDDAKLASGMRVHLDPRERAWDRILRNQESGEIIHAMVTEAVKGGLVVDLGVRGFVPASHVGLGGPPNLNSFVGQSMPLRVIEVDRRRQKVVLSNRVVAEEERAAQRRETMGTLEEGQVREGIVRRLTDIGAFVDLGGVDGLLHVSEISWKRVEKASEVLKRDQKIQVKILKLDPSQGRISLSMRRLLPDPWSETSKQLAVGKPAKATVQRIVNGGVVVDLGGDVEGFIPMSELANRRVTKAEEVVRIGQEVEATVIEIRPRDRRIVLSLRQQEEQQDRRSYDSYVQKRNTEEKTTIGDLFGHLFKDLMPAEPEPVADAEPKAEARIEETEPKVEARAEETETATEPIGVTAEATTDTTEAPTDTTEAPTEVTTDRNGKEPA